MVEGVEGMSGMHPAAWSVVPLSLLWLWMAALGGLVSLAALAFWIWMIVDCAQREFEGPSLKIIWILVIIFTHWLGALIYFLVGRPQGRLPGARQASAS